jgi:hypothetical protein
LLVRAHVKLAGNATRQKEQQNLTNDDRVTTVIKRSAIGQSFVASQKNCDQPNSNM